MIDTLILWGWWVVIIECIAVVFIHFIIPAKHIELERLRLYILQSRKTSFDNKTSDS